MRIAVLLNVVAVAGLGCSQRSSGGPCNLTVQNSSTITVDGWCVHDPGRMVVDSGSVTVVSQAVDNFAGTLLRIETATGTRTTLVGNAGDPSLDGTLADGGSELFFAACDGSKHCSIFALPRAGGPLRTVAAADASVANTYGRTFDLTVDASNVYWLTDGIWSAPRAGGTATRLGDGAGIDDGSYRPGIAVDAAAVYVTRPSAGVVVRQPLDGSAATMLATGRHTPSRISIVGSTIFWLEQGMRGVDCTPSDGTLQAWSHGAQKPLVSGLAGASDFAVVGGGKLVYSNVGAYCNVITKPMGSIDELSLQQGAAVEVKGAQLVPEHVASDGNEVYWTVVSDWDASGAILHAPLR